MKIKELVVGISILLATSIISILFMELTLKFFYPQLTLNRGEKLSPNYIDKSEYTPWKFIPNSKDALVSPFGEFNVPAEINSMGLREGEFSPTKTNDSRRIIVLGDSFTFGVGVKIEETYAKKLETLLTTRAINKYETINMGFADGSYSTDIQYLVLKKRGLEFDPDIVIVGLFVGNDISDLDMNIWHNVSNGLPQRISCWHLSIDDKNRLRMNNEAKDYYKRYRSFGLINYYLSKESHLFVLIKKLATILNSVPPKTFLKELPENLAKNLDRVRRLIGEMNAICVHKNIKFVVVLVPENYQVWDHSWKKYEKFYGQAETSRFMPQASILEYCGNNGIECIDLLPEFISKANGGGYYYKIDGHWDQQGHELAANIIANELISRKIVE